MNFGEKNVYYIYYVYIIVNIGTVYLCNYLGTIF